MLKTAEINYSKHDVRSGCPSNPEECADEVEKLEPALREAVLCPAADAAVEERRAVLACDAPDVVVRALDAHVLDLQLGAGLTHESLPLERSWCESPCPSPVMR